MPKMKTHSGAKKRFKKTASGKIKVKRPGARHLNLGKGGSRLRRLAETAYLSPGHAKQIAKVLTVSSI
jgi:large subunit ribosomal protein L35